MTRARTLLLHGAHARHRSQVVPEASLRVTEIFLSLQGESSRVGLPTVFVRLTGCPLRCHYCDTAYAFHGGTRLPFNTILERVTEYHARYVTVTGGEPLAQPGCPALLQRLCDLGYRVSLETSGALDIRSVDKRVMKVMDLKTPGSGEAGKNDYQNIQYLTATDEVKFVIRDRIDYDWAKEIMQRFSFPCEILFSPSSGEIDPAQMAEWILEDQLPVRFQIQLHKVVWGDIPGR
ncbi:MAG: 7-carboxy-7-deazaguanine synthase QueE [Gammaproteobacteria bacterium]